MSDYINSRLRCTNCRRTVMIKMHKTDTGNLTVKCPVCEHDHYRYVENGVITEDRWRSSSQVQTVYAYNVSTVSGTSTTASAFTYSSWDNSGTARY